MSLRNRARSLAAPVLCASLLVTCGGGNPTSSRPPSAAPPAVPPPPAAPPLPFGVSAVCNRIGLGDPHGICRPDSPSFLPNVDQAITQVVGRHPEIFDLNDERGGGGFRIRMLGQFYVELLKALEDQNLCAVFDGEEVGVKNSQAFHDQYKVANSDAHLRRGRSEYRATCFPAGMPIPQAAPRPVPGCSLPPSVSLACDHEDVRRFQDDVEASISELQRAHPELFNGEQALDVNGYNQGVVSILSKKGYCAIAGDEMGVKKSNEVSEAYDILLADNHIRHGGYRVTCFPADF